LKGGATGVDAIDSDLAPRAASALSSDATGCAEVGSRATPVQRSGWASGSWRTISTGWWPWRP